MIPERDKFLSFERRKFPRLKENIFILYRLESAPSDKFNKAFTNNISARGLMFEGETNIPAGTKLELEIYQPIKRSKTVILSIPAFAEVIWIRNIEKQNSELGENKYRIGIEFLEIKQQDRKKIVKYIEELLPT